MLFFNKLIFIFHCQHCYHCVKPVTSKNDTKLSNTTAVYFHCLSWKITGSQICQQNRINIVCTKIPITIGFNVYSSTLLPFGQLCYPKKWAMSTLLPAYNWPSYRGYYGYKFDIAHMCSKDIFCSLYKILQIRNKIWLCFEHCTEAICTSLPIGRWFHPDLGEIIWVFLIQYFSTR